MYRVINGSQPKASLIAPTSQPLIVVVVLLVLVLVLVLEQSLLLGSIQFVFELAGLVSQHCLPAVLTNLLK